MRICVELQTLSVVCLITPSRTTFSPCLSAMQSLVYSISMAKRGFTVAVYVKLTYIAFILKHRVQGALIVVVPLIFLNFL